MSDMNDFKERSGIHHSCGTTEVICDLSTEICIGTKTAIWRYHQSDIINTFMSGLKNMYIKVQLA